jgi:hypothetical protein
MVPPVEVTYTTSRPARSASALPMFAISTNSSEADAPPVWSSEINRVDGGQPTAASGAPTERTKGATAARATVLSARMAKRATTAAARARSTERPPGGQDHRMPGGTARTF